MAGEVLLERDAGIATVVLSHPERMNALTLPMWLQVGEHMRALSADTSLRCVILKGAGGNAFAAGADISEFATVRADRKSTRLNSSHSQQSRMPSSA